MTGRHFYASIVITQYGVDGTSGLNSLIDIQNLAATHAFKANNNYSTLVSDSRKFGR